MLKILLCSLILGGVFSGSAIAAPPGQEPEGMKEFIPRAGYSRTAKMLRMKRLAGIPMAPGQSLSLQGSRSLPVICLSFNNVPAAFPATDYQKLLFSNGVTDWSMTTYYDSISHHLFKVSGKVLGPFNLSKFDSDYEGHNNGLGGPHFGKLLEEAFSQADVQVDFGEYDNDGEDGIPNSGDDDGKVDTVFLIHPELGGECGKAVGAKNIWSHSWHYSEGLGHSAPFETNDSSHRVDPETGVPVPNAKILLEDYTIQPGLSCSSTATNKKIIDIGVFCHEYGHALGLPDLYDRTPPKAECVGNWCLMASGSYGGDNDHADRPSHMSAWCKYYLGWADVKPLSTALSHSFEPVDKRNRIYRFDIPETNKLEYFLIEYRRKTAWDEFLRGEGLAIWHIDERIGSNSPDWPFAPEDQGQNDSPNTLENPQPPIFSPDHQLVALVQADGEMNLELTNGMGNRGDALDLFSSGDFNDDATGKKGTRSYDGKKTTLELLGIQIASEGTVTAQVKVGLPIPSAPPAAAPRTVPSMTKDEKLTVQFVKSIREVVKEKGVDGLNAQQREQLENVPDYLLHQASEGDPKVYLLKAAAAGRTKELDKSMTDAMPMDGFLKDILNSDDDQQCTVQFDHTGKAIERITNLSVGIGSMSPQQDALQRTAAFQELVPNNGLKFLAAPVAGDAGTQTQRFSRNMTVDGTSLPVWGKQLIYYYTNDKLVGIANAPMDKDLVITGKPGDLTKSAAQEAVGDLLGLPKARWDQLDAKEGLYIPLDQPSRANIAIKVSVPAGKQQRNIDVFLDSQSGKVLEIK